MNLHCHVKCCTWTYYSQWSVCYCHPRLRPLEAARHVYMNGAWLLVDLSAALYAFRWQCRRQTTVCRKGVEVAGCLLYIETWIILTDSPDFLSCFTELCYALRSHSVSQHKPCPVPLAAWTSLAALGWGLHRGLLPCESQQSKNVTDFDSILNKLLPCSWGHFEDLI